MQLLSERGEKLGKRLTILNLVEEPISAIYGNLEKTSAGSVQWFSELLQVAISKILPATYFGNQLT